MSRTSQETSTIFQRRQQVTLLVHDWQISIHFACPLDAFGCFWMTVTIMIDGSVNMVKPNRKFDFKLQSSHVVENRYNRFLSFVQCRVVSGRFGPWTFSSKSFSSKSKSSRSTTETVLKRSVHVQLTSSRAATADREICFKHIQTRNDLKHFKHVSVPNLLARALMQTQWTDEPATHVQILPLCDLHAFYIWF